MHNQQRIFLESGLKQMLLAFALVVPLLSRAQTVVQPEIGPNDHVMLEMEAHPRNLDEVKQMIGYPAAAKEAGIEGTVRMRVQVDEKGQYVRHIVVNDPHPILTEAVTSKISELHFLPGIQASKPIKVWADVTFAFKLPAEKNEEADAPKPPAKIFFSLDSALAYPDPAHVTELHLNGKSLKTVPLEILRFPNLIILDLSDNQLTKIPAEIQALKQLRWLLLSKNRLSTLPAELWDMPNLLAIFVDNNVFLKKTQELLEKEHGDKLLPIDGQWKVKW